MLRKLVTILALAAVALSPGQVAAHGRQKTPIDSAASRASATRRPQLFLDFENGRMGAWRFVRGFCDSESLNVRLAGRQDGNRSAGNLHCSVRHGLSKGSISFILSENHISPIPVRPRTTVAWCWKVSETDTTNGFWLCLNVRNTKTGEKWSVRYDSWRTSSFDVARVFFDQKQVWHYHDEPVYDYLWRRFDPSLADSFVIECVTLAASRAWNLEAWIDNIWIGEGTPPDSINTIEKSDSAPLPGSSKLEGFSYGFLDRDWIPDRVDVYRDRAEIFLDPHANDGKSGKPGRPREADVQVIPIRPVQTISFDPQRVDGFASMVDLNGDGASDILFHFDDLLGNTAYENRLPRDSFRQVPLKAGSLMQDGQYSYGAASSDIDLDGDMDILQFNPYRRAHLFGGMRLLRNEGDFLFVDCTDDAGILSQLGF
ncbi:MAG TPA: VCBS repeat-containing protein, partial [Candidatus Bathyarchaeia archaeon]|nr:VCBS repeat-containing protein [Candidatus Bathyarchaeia archaeon]